MDPMRKAAPTTRGGPCAKSVKRLPGSGRVWTLRSARDMFDYNGYLATFLQGKIVLVPNEP